MTLEDIQPGIPPPTRPKPPAPLLPVAVGIILGIVADDILTLPTWGSVLLLGIGVLPFIYGTVALPAASRVRPVAVWTSFIALVIAAMGLGSLRHAIADRWLADDHIVFFTDDEPILAQLQGRVLLPPRITEPEPGVPRPYPVGPKTRLVLEATQVAGQHDPIPVSGKVAVVVRGPLLSLHVGDTVQTTGWLYRPAGPQNPGAYDWALHQRRNGLLVGMSCDHVESVVVVAKAVTGGWQGIRNRVRARLRGYLLDDAFEAGDPGAGVMTAMVLGERSAVSRAMNEAFVRTGNAHFLAASGMHVGWLAFVVWMVLRLLGVYYRKRTIFVVTVLVLLLLCVEPRPSIMRAALIAIVWCIGVYRGAGSNLVNSLALSAVILLIRDPMDWFRPAFQFSFLAVLALACFQPALAEMCAKFIAKKTRWPVVAWFFDRGAYFVSLMQIGRQPGPGPTGKLSGPLYWLVQFWLLAVSAWFVVTPLSCYCFNKFTPWGAVATFLLWFIAAPTTCVGFIKLLMGLLLPSSSAIFGPLLGALTAGMLGFVHALARVPWTILDGRSPSLAWILAVYAVLGVWVYRRSWIPWKHAFKVLALVLILWWAIPPRWARAEPGALQVWMLAVGNGTGTVIELPDNKVLVYDFGTRSSFDVGPVGAAFLKHRGIDRIHTIFVSHANFDHFSGIKAIAKDIDIGRVVVNDQFEPFATEGSSSRRFLNEMRSLGIPIEVTHGRHTFDDMGDAIVQAIWPPAADRRPVIDANEGSTVLRITYQGRSILLTGDIAEMGMASLMADAETKADVEIKADALALPHHGSVVHNTARFIASVDPRVAIRSSGQRRSLTTNDIERFAGDRQYFNTADDGCILVRIQDGELTARAVTADD
ncbi:MAG: ComEC/Rec2 family competence protein [Phycisphaerae bacterium]|nr:ComEC/Rec2 family competence protein [Phycisphaerae bacterium]